MARYKIKLSLVNESIQNQISRFLRQLCYSPHLSLTSSHELASGFKWPNEFYWFVLPTCNVRKQSDHQYSAYTENILNSKVNCLEWFPQNYKVERIIEQSNFHISQLKHKSAIVPIYIHDPQVDKVISGIVANMNNWEPNIIEQIIKAIQERADLHFIDIGANIGALALPVAVVSKRKVIAIDSNTQNLLRLSKSAKLNKLNSLYLFENAITEVSCDRMQISEIDKHNFGRWRVVQSQNKEKSSNYLRSEIKSATIDNLLPMLSSLGIKQAVLKIDIEGSEYSAFHSASQFFKIIDVPYVFMEWVFYGDWNGTTDEVKVPKDKTSIKFNQQQFLKTYFHSLGYEAFRDINSKTSFVGDEPRTVDIVLKKIY
jgi:FkbM family methyltransferase